MKFLDEITLFPADVCRAGMITVFLIVGAIVGASISGFYTELPVYQTRLQEQVSAFQSTLAAKGIRGTDKVLVEYLNPGAVMSLTARLLTGLGSALSNIVLILLTVAFMLFEASSVPVKLRAVLGHPRQVFPQFTRFVDDIERYMVIKTVISLATGILVGIWLFILGVEFPILWGSLLGPVGMVLCVPLTMTLKFACENNEGTRWIAVLLGPEVPARPKTSVRLMA